MLKKFHSFHMVSMSPWPLINSIMIFSLVYCMNIQMFLKFKFIYFFAMILMFILAMNWWKDVIREVSYQGLHSKKVIKGIKMGMILFILSEIMFFFSFFWSYFFFILSPDIMIGQMWPPLSIESFNPMNVPLLNTIILISSGISVTWSHNSLMNNKFYNTSISLSITWMLGIYFSILQYMEYVQSSFNFSDSCYGSIFFMATGFHGIHVIIGSLYLLIVDLNLKNLNSVKNHFLMMDLSSWYWHFVDVVWLFLYLCIYWWGK